VTDLIPGPPGKTFAPGQVAYLLEVYVDSEHKRSFEVPFVASVEFDEAPSVSIEHTFGEPWRDILAVRDATGAVTHGYRERQIRVSGSSGFEHRLGYRADGARLFAGGFDLFLEFRKFLEGYSADLATWKATVVDTPPPARFGEPKLIFRALREGESHAVEVTSLTPQLSGIGQLWSYSLALRAYGPAPARQEGWLEGLLGKIAGAVATATAFVDSLTAWVAYATEAEGAVTTTSQQLLEPIRAVGRLAQQITALAQGGRPIADLPKALVEETFRVADQGVLALEAFADTFSAGALDDETDAFRRSALAKLDEARMRSLEFLGMRRSGLSSSGAVPAGLDVGALGSPAAADTKAVGHVLGDGETVASLVTSTFGSLDRLAEVLALNGMADPFTLADGSPLRAGATVLVPAVDGVAPVANGLDLFGTDLLLSAEGDLVTTGDEPTDWLTIGGQASLDQAIRVRVLTERGDFGPFPGLGLIARIGDDDADFSAALLASDTRAQLERDRRVLQVGPVTVAEVDGGTVLQSVPYQPVAGAETTLTFA